MTPAVWAVWLVALGGLLWAAWWTRQQMREEARREAERVAVRALVEALQPIACGVCQEQISPLFSVALADGHTWACRRCADVLKPLARRGGV